ncbi:hypothetical protein DFA_12254 [Cavenderia fasciculata]|uniref:BRCT domain-containing protein n=1 Tax=Cavenderia fasciculata TaxID=261658 RepID=F4QCV6_CACFS|nr:uncharacterized protein DFA_12254 [Cavenderia fasciculata]EGG14480.1 hypothetical protein DFA_12254 [Cavenderia fasciculata]|eukprot:XP_004353889.1 hypothetical protein DFA_12254 [Cavenderia fasciculata]
MNNDTSNTTNKMSPLKSSSDLSQMIDPEYFKRENDKKIIDQPINSNNNNNNNSQSSLPPSSLSQQQQSISTPTKNNNSSTSTSTSQSIQSSPMNTSSLQNMNANVIQSSFDAHIQEQTFQTSSPTRKRIVRFTDPSPVSSPQPSQREQREHQPLRQSFTQNESLDIFGSLDFSQTFEQPDSQEIAPISFTLSTDGDLIFTLDDEEEEESIKESIQFDFDIYQSMSLPIWDAVTSQDPKMVMKRGGKIKRKRGLVIPNWKKKQPEVTIDDLMKQNYLKIGDRLTYSIAGSTHTAILLADGYIEYGSGNELRIRLPSVHAWIIQILSKLTPNKKYHWFSPWDSIFIKGKSLNYIRKSFESKNRKEINNNNDEKVIIKTNITKKKREEEEEEEEIESQQIKKKVKPTIVEFKQPLPIQPQPSLIDQDATQKVDEESTIKVDEEATIKVDQEPIVDEEATIKVYDEFDPKTQLLNSTTTINLNQVDFNSQEMEIEKENENEKEKEPSQKSSQSSHHSSSSSSSLSFPNFNSTSQPTNNQHQNNNNNNNLFSSQPLPSKGGHIGSPLKYNTPISSQPPPSQSKNNVLSTSIQFETSQQFSQQPKESSISLPLHQPSLKSNNSNVSEQQKISQTFSIPDLSQQQPSQLFSIPGYQIESTTGPVILGTGLSRLMQIHIITLTNSIGGRYVTSFDQSVTHIVCATEEQGQMAKRTIKYQMGVAKGLWIVSFDWILESLNEQKWLDEDAYEIQGDEQSGIQGSPNKARQQLLFSEKRLFYGLAFYLAGEFDQPSRQEIESVIKEAGGIVLDAPPPKPSNTKELLKSKCTVIVHPSYTSSHQQLSQIHLTTKQLPISYKWIFDSISNYQLIPKDKYLIFKSSTINQSNYGSIHTQQSHAY